MLKKIFLLIMMIAISSALFSKTAILTDQSKVVMFTCGPGEELYAGFGHSALWVSDPSAGVDRLYNYGTFDFETPHFYAKFTRGKLNYMITVVTAKRFLAEYEYRKIAVFGQKLNLSLDERQKMYDFLENNLLPENCFYKYDFFYDNCATRIRDVLIKVTDGKVNFNTPTNNQSFRQMLFPYLKHTPWTKFGINMILGLSADKKATPWDYMFLPEYMKDEFGNATIEKDGSSKKLVEADNQFLKSKISFENNKWDDPIALFSLLLIIAIIISVIEKKNGEKFKWIDNIIFTISVLAGVFLFFMWVGTDHSATKQNMNILWLFPGQLVFLLSPLFNNIVKRKLLLSALIYQVLVSFLMFVWPQETEISFMLISLIFGVRIFSKIINNGYLKNIKIKS